MQSETWSPPEDLYLPKSQGSNVTSGPKPAESSLLIETLSSRLKATYPACHISTLHFQVVVFKAQTIPDAEIAGIIGKSEAWVEKVVAMPWYVDALTEALSLLGKSGVDDLLEAVEIDAIKTLIRLKNDPKASAAVQKACAAELLDRRRGKPMQYVKTEAKFTTYDNAAAQAKALQREMDSLDDQLLKRGVLSETNT